MEIDGMMRRLRSIGLALLIPVALGTTSARADVLDGLVFGIKCLGAADRQACEERSKREAEETRERLRQQQPSAGSAVPSRTGDTGGESIGKRAYRTWNQNVVCYEFAKRSGRDIDTNYARAVTRYKLMTPREVELQKGPIGAGLYAAGYLHQVTPGALYRFAQVVHSADVSGGKRQYKLVLDLARDGAGTLVSGQYCVTTDDPAGWQDLPPQVLSSLNNTF